MASGNTWPDLIGHLVLLKQQIDDLDPTGVRTYMLPRVAATEERLRETEALLGEPLDSGYRAFLGYADGWPEFSISVQLMGTADQLGAVRATADNYLDVTLAAAATGWRRLELAPVAVASDDKDVIAVGRPGTQVAGRIVWFAGEEVERHANFKEWFEDEVASHQRALDKLRTTRESR